MRKELKKAWVKALRSGKFKKGRCYLRQSTPKGDRYCCLGVLCEVQNARWKKVKGIPPCYTMDGDAGALSERRRKRVGLSEGAEAKLIGFNDTHGWSFNKIAAWIEKNL